MAPDRRTSIDSLNRVKNPRFIVATVTKKSEILKEANEEKFIIKLRDREGGEIAMTFKNEFVEKFFNEVLLGKTYKIEDYEIIQVPDGTTRSKTKNELECIGKTTIKEARMPAEFPASNSNQQDLSTLQNIPEVQQLVKNEPMSPSTSGSQNANSNLQLASNFSQLNLEESTKNAISEFLKEISQSIANIENQFKNINEKIILIADEISK